MSIDLSPMGFRKTPFTREVAVTERFMFDPQREATEALAEAVKQRMSAVLIAPAGTGKTVALRALVASLPEARYHVRYVKVTGLSKRDLCKEIAAVCGIAQAGTYPALVRKLQERFEQLASTDGVRPVLILDEAHDLRPESLAMLRLLTNFEMDARLVVSVILAGQLPLRAMLARADQEAMAQRLAHYATLRLLSHRTDSGPKETRSYLEHRSAVAGAQTAQFDNDATESIYEMSRGNLRAIDRLALKALQLAVRSDRTVAASGDVIAARKVLWP